MAMSAAAKAIALVLFVAAIAGATYAVNESLGITVEPPTLLLEPVHQERAATPGHTTSFLVNVENRGATDRSVRLAIDGAAEGTSGAVVIPAGSTTAIFVPADVPADAAVGTHLLTLRALDGDRVLRVRDNAVTLRVLADAPGIEVGDNATLRYVGRLADTGRAFASNDPALVGEAFLKTETFQYNPQVLPLTTAPRNVVLGIHEGVLGMQPGETRTFTFGFEKGYGPPAENDTIPRRETIERTLIARNELQRVSRETFDEYIAEEGQGDPSTYEVGDTFTLYEEPNVWPYRITFINETTVTYRLGASVGDKFTLYPYWPQGTEIVAIDDEKVEFYTTPTTPPAPEGTCPPRNAAATAACFTMRTEWPDMSVLDAEPNATHVVIRHDPPEAFRYTTTATGETREVVVLDVLDDEIIVAVASAHPLAGRSLTFDVTVLAVDKR